MKVSTVATKCVSVWRAWWGGLSPSSEGSDQGCPSVLRGPSTEGWTLLLVPACELGDRSARRMTLNNRAHTQLRLGAENHKMRASLSSQVRQPNQGSQRVCESGTRNPDASSLPFPAFWPDWLPPPPRERSVLYIP